MNPAANSSKVKPSNNSNNEKNQLKKIYKSTFEDNEKVLYEQIKGNQYIYYDAEKQDYLRTNWVIIDGVYIMPCYGEEVTREVVLLADNVADYGTILDLVIEIKEYIHQWVDIPEQYEVFAAWYVLLTYVYDKVNTINYLRVMGDTGTGKSRFLHVIGRICYKATIGSGSVTVAAVKRIIDKWKGTLIIDEGDVSDSDEKNELIKLFNLGFEKNNTMFNCDKNDPSQLEFFNPYCPKVISTRRQFDDQALEARCLTHVSHQTIRRDIPVVLPDRFFVQQQVLRNKLLKFRFDYYNQIDIDKALKVDMGVIEPRIRQAVNSLLPLIVHDPEAIDLFREFLNDYNQQVIEERSMSFDGSIINTIIDLICEGHKEISSSLIANQITNGGFKISNRTVGKHLKQLGIKVMLKRDGELVKKCIIFDSKFIEISKRYCTEEVKLCNVVTFVTSILVDPAKTLQNPKNTEKPIYNKIHRCTNSVVTNVTSLQNYEKITTLVSDGNNKNISKNDQKNSIISSNDLLKFLQQKPDKNWHENELENLNDDSFKIGAWLETLAKNGDIMAVEPLVWRVC